MNMKYIEKKSIVPLPQANGSLSDTRNITDKVTNGYSARVIEEDLIETITNENGTAIKFPDGTMICRNTVMKNCNMTIAMSNGGYRSSGFITSYAEEFIEKPDMVAVSSSGAIDNGVIIEHTSSNTNNSQFVYIWWSVSSVSDLKDHYMTYEAIGRWK